MTANALKNAELNHKKHFENYKAWIYNDNKAKSSVDIDKFNLLKFRRKQQRATRN